MAQNLRSARKGAPGGSASVAEALRPPPRALSGAITDPIQLESGFGSLFTPCAAPKLPHIARNAEGEDGVGGGASPAPSSMIDSARSSPAGSGALRRAKSDAAEAGAGLRLQSVRTLALAFLCGAVYAMGMTALSGGGLAAWREGASPPPPPLLPSRARGRHLGRACCCLCPDPLHLHQI